MLRRAATLAAMLVMGVSAVASAAPSYLLKHPKRQHCKWGYTRTIKHVHGHRQVWCVRRPLRVTPRVLPPSPTPRAGTLAIVNSVHAPGTSFITVGVEVRTFAGQVEAGVPVTLKLLDSSAGNVIVGTFTQPAIGQYIYCTIGLLQQGGNLTFTGQAVASYPACALGPVTVAESHVIEIVGFFGGNEKLLSSLSETKKFWP